MRSSKKWKPGTAGYRRERGAVTVFLIIILVPCIALSSICVDLSRVQLSKSVAESAGDLALNTLMTNYDGDLKEWYGMIGSCQEINTYYSNASGYFTRALTSKGMADDEFLLLSDVVSSVTGKDSIYDLLQVNVVDDVKIDAVSGADLANPTLIKDQIVEFMKFRGPIELTKTIISRLPSADELKAFKESDDNEPLIEQKEDFYEAEGELTMAAYESYKAIMKYKNAADSLGLTKQKLAEYVNTINGTRDAYQIIHNIAVSNLINTGDLKEAYKRVTIDKYEYTYSMRNVCSKREKDEETEETTYYINSSKMDRLVSAAVSDIEDFEKAISEYESRVNNIPDYDNNDVNDIQWWVRMHEAVYGGKNYHNKVATAAKNMMKSYGKLKAAQECEDDPDSEPSRGECEDAIRYIDSLHRTYLTSRGSGNSTYIQKVSALETISKNNLGNVNAAQLKVTVNGTTATVQNAIAGIGSELTAIYSNLETLRDLLDVAIDGDRKTDVPSLDKLEDLADNYSKELEDYEGMAAESTTDMGKTERKAIEIDKQENRISDEINKDGVQELKTRLTNIRSQIEDILDAIDSVKYGGSKVKDITTFDAFKTEAQKKVKKDSISLYDSEIRSYANSTFDQLFKSEGITLRPDSNHSYDPQLDVNTPGLLAYFIKTFGEVKDETVQEKKKDQDEAKDKGKQAAQDAKDKGRYHGGGESITPSNSSSGSVGMLSGALGSVVELVEILTDISKITKIRDDLYVTSYIMEMFSYATFEEEGIYALVENKTELTLPQSGHTPEAYESIRNNQWKDTNVEFSNNKSLTNKMIDRNNNKAYGAEVEFILKGGQDNGQNVKDVYGDIYAIRYPLNLVSAFQHFWSGSNNTARAISTVAGAIQGVTLGVVPAPLTKVILIPILAIFETCKDMDRLEAGFPVELYKLEDTDWWIGVPDADTLRQMQSISDFLDCIMGNKDNPDKGMFYSDYLTIFTYLGLKSANKEQIYKRVADVIENNMAKATGGAYKMSNVKMYFTLSATLRVSPMMVALPYYFDEYDNLMMTTTDWCTFKIDLVRGYS